IVCLSIRLILIFLIGIVFLFIFSFVVFFAFVFSIVLRFFRFIWFFLLSITLIFFGFLLIILLFLIFIFIRFWLLIRFFIFILIMDLHTCACWISFDPLISSLFTNWRNSKLIRFARLGSTDFNSLCVIGDLKT